MGSATATVKSLLLAAAVLQFSGCPHPDETAQRPVPENRPSPALAQAEQSFNPSDYDRPAPPKHGDSTTLSLRPGEIPEELPPSQQEEQAPGFRVQLLSTTSIDEANARKQYAESLFPAEWFYLQYDPPAYKIRAGNFLLRLDADRFRAQIAARGFPGAWVVPERVFRNPPPPPRDVPQKPK